MSLVFYRRHCAIEFPDEVILTGGMDDPNNVTAYDLEGFKRHLPNLVNGRYFHGCSHFTNNYEQLVREF